MIQSLILKHFSSKNSIRMCVCCRNRFSQKELLRLKINDLKIQIFDGKGRSFYLCKECICNKNYVKNLIKIKKAPKDYNIIKEQIEEIKNKWQKSD